MLDWRREAWTNSPPQKIQMLLDTWCMAFDRFEGTLSEAQKQRNAIPLQLLRVYYTMLSLMLRGASSKTESVYEQFHEEFKSIVNKYDDFARQWALNESTKFFAGGVGTLYYHMGLIPPLFFTAVKCRDASTRMAALNHLAALRVHENNWNSCTAYVIARKIIEIETTRAIINNRVGLVHEEDLIRPIEAFITDKRMTQAGLDYAVFPYQCESPMVMHETIDLLDCGTGASASVQWVSCLTFRIFWQCTGLIHPSH
jgi:hypothetical protein